MLTFNIIEDLTVKLHVNAFFSEIGLHLDLHDSLVESNLLNSDENTFSYTSDNIQLY